MGIGKMLGLAALGIGAIAAAPFTGGGSILGAATLAGSLAGAGAIAAATAAGAAGAGVGYALSRKEEEEEAIRKGKDEEIARNNIKTKKLENVIQEHEKHTNLILALSAIGFSMANADGKISPEEAEEIDGFIGGLASQAYPEHIINKLKELRIAPPTFNEALKYLQLVESVEYLEIKNLLVAIIDADDFAHPNEKAFLSAFDVKVNELNKGK